MRGESQQRKSSVQVFAKARTEAVQELELRRGRCHGLVPWKITIGCHGLVPWRGHVRSYVALKRDAPRGKPVASESGVLFLK